MAYHQTTKWPANNDETPWCSSFVNWVITASGREGTDNASAKSWLTWNQGIAVDAPEAGDIVLVRDSKNNAGDPENRTSKGYHVGFFLSRTATHVRILGGNQSNMVKESDFPLAKDGENSSTKWVIKGYRRPKKSTAVYLSPR